VDDLGSAAKAEDFISGLPVHLQEAVNDIRARIIDNKVRTETFNTLIGELGATGFWQVTERLLLEDRAQFGDFMLACRGPVPAEDAAGQDVLEVGDEPGAALPSQLVDLTKACAEAWQAQQQREAGSIWQNLAAQAPPGILLLFLLATLGGLYRYNLRLAGFHHSRADLLELLHIEGGLSSPQEIVELADTLAADKVEFARTKTPADQAVELARALAARGK